MTLTAPSSSPPPALKLLSAVIRSGTSPPGAAAGKERCGLALGEAPNLAQFVGFYFRVIGVFHGLRS